VEVPAGGRSELQVAIDGQAQALPAQGEIRFSLPGGMHTIRASRPAHEAWEQSVEVIAGTTQAVSIQLRALARLMIELPGKRPDNFQVSVDGRPRQVPSGKLMVVPCEPGTHTVRATSAKGQFERLVAVSLHQDLPVVVAILAESRLAGGWSGQIEIDAQAVERKLNEAKANPLQRALTQQLVAALSAGRMEIEFQPDGSYRIHTQLGSLSSNSGGQWVIAEESSRRVVVELTPQSGPVELRQITFVDENTFTTDLPSKAAGFGCFRCVRTDRR